MTELSLIILLGLVAGIVILLHLQDRREDRRARAQRSPASALRAQLPAIGPSQALYAIGDYLASTHAEALRSAGREPAASRADRAAYEIYCIAEGLTHD